MRLALLYNPRLLCERLADISSERRRFKKLRGTAAANLGIGHIDSLELLEALQNNPPSVIYDIGANVGTWTLLAKSIFPRAEVHAFEPLEPHCAAFEEKTHSLAGVTLHKFAVGAAPARANMEVYDRSDTSSLLEMTEACRRSYGLCYERTVSVNVERLDDLICRKTIPKPDLLKLDIQGYELEALRGGEGALRNARAVLSEVSFVELYEGQCLFHEVVGFLAERGFRLCALGNGTKVGAPLIQTDALFVAESVLPQIMQ